MAYDEKLAGRVRTLLAGKRSLAEKKMFGGVCHMMEGNMLCGVLENHLILRLGEKTAEEVLTLPEVKPFDITGRPMKGWVMVEPVGFTSDDRLHEWLVKARRFVKTLPRKS